MKRLFIYLLLISAYAQGTVFETFHFRDILEHVTEDSLVILDIDDTLLLPAQTLGTDVWFCYRLKQYESSGLSANAALHKTLAEWEAIRKLTQVNIVEEGTDRIISELQAKGTKVIGLTTQGLGLATCTVNQLNHLQIDLAKTSPFRSEDQFFLNGNRGTLYRKGILFTAATPKGAALMKLLQSGDYKPKKIIFINDKLSHLQDVENDVEKSGMEFVGLRYSYGDERVRQFRPEIAEIQFKHSSFAHILSDEEAEEYLLPR